MNRIGKLAIVNIVLDRNGQERKGGRGVASGGQINRRSDVIIVVNSDVIIVVNSDVIIVVNSETFLVNLSKQWTVSRTSL